MGILRPANPIYCDTIVITLNYVTQATFPDTIVHQWMDNEKLDMNSLLKEFQKIWQNNSELLQESYDYKKAAQPLILDAFLQRVINDTGYVIPEFGLNKGRVDIRVEYVGKTYPIEIKLENDPMELSDTQDQIEEYMQRCGSNEGWLVFFDNNPKKNWDKKIYWKSVSRPSGKLIHIVGC
jgi:hypothetical protein